MPRPPRDTPLKKTFVCGHCNKKFRSNGGRTRHINARHNGQQMDPPQSQEVDNSSVSSCPGFLSPTSLGNIFDSPSHNSDTFFGAGTENDFNFDNDGSADDTPPPSPSRDKASISTEYHPYLNGKMNNI
jgi:hypothetical protein